MIERMLDQIVEMQRWAAQNPLQHKDLLTFLFRVRIELEKKL